ncbi:MAG: hypothetical protein H6679_01475 [Epsilonproteobacteria bacterium]|nr:hypothetical protein [Campylobacterota bacterium]
MKNRNQFLTLALTATLCVQVGQAMDEERLAEKEQREMAQQNPIAHFQPKSLKEICSNVVASKYFEPRSLKDICCQTIINSTEKLNHKELKNLTEYPSDNHMVLKKELVSRFYPELLKAHENKFGKMTLKHDSTVNCCCLSPDNQYLAVGSDEGILHIWKYENNTWKLDTTTNGGDFINPVQFASHNCLLTKNNAEIRFYSYKDGALEPTNNFHNRTSSTTGNVNPSTTCYGPNGIWVAIFKDGFMAVYNRLNLATNVFCGGFAHSIEYCNGSQMGDVRCIIDSENKNQLVILTFKNANNIMFLRYPNKEIWNNESYSMERINLPGNFSAISLSPNVQFLVSKTLNNVTQIWKYQDKTFKLDTTIGNKDIIDMPFFSDDNQTLAVPLTDNTVQLWQYQGSTWAHTTTLTCTNPINALCFSPDGQYLINTSSQDKVVQIYPTPQYFENLSMQELTDLTKTLPDKIQETINNLIDSLRNVLTTNNEPGNEQ